MIALSNQDKETTHLNFCFGWGQPFMIYGIGSCRCTSPCVASYILYVDMHSGMSVHVFVGLMLSFIPGNSWSYVQCFFLDSTVVLS